MVINELAGHRVAGPLMISLSLAVRLLQDVRGLGELVRCVGS